MYLHRDDVSRMMKIFNKFPDVEVAEIQQDTSSGIGAHTTMIIETRVNDEPGRFEIVVSSVENW
jgi:hypothetical protein